MLARSLSTRTIRGASIGALAIAFTSMVQFPLAAQDRSLIPTDVKIVGDGTSATVTWAAVPVEGVTYRVLRRAETEKAGVDLTKPVSGTSYVDPGVTAGLTYFYELIAVFRDGTSASAEPVTFIAPSPLVAQPIAVAQPTILKETTRAPTAVTGITVQGTTASAVISWQPVTGALSYSVTRFKPNSATTGSLGSTTTSISRASWNDTGPQGLGFAIPGTYTYDVTAVLSSGKSVTGRATWTRPDPSCAAPPSGQPMLTALNPPAVEWIGQIPDVAGFLWAQSLSNPIMAYRIERGVQGSNTWTLLATSCDGSLGSALAGYQFVDRSGIVPNTAYLYKVTALAGNGEAGSKTLTYTSPSPSVLHWLSATTSGNTVTMRFRYEPPSTNAPILPSDKFYVTSPYGLNQLVQIGGASKPAFGVSSECWTAGGCSFVVSGVPSGTHVFTVTASWISGPVLLGKISANTTVTIP